MSRTTRLGIFAISTAFLIGLTGCSFGGEQAVNKMKEEPEKKITYVEDEKSLDKKSNEQANNAKNDPTATTEMVQRELYVLDKNGYVVPQTFMLPKTQEVAKQSLEYLVKDGPVNEILSNGFQAVLPAGTQVLGVNLLEDGTIVADFSKEFSNYKPEEEKKILEALTWTLTQFDNVKNVKLRINGTDKPFMPVNGTPIGDGVSKVDGINLDSGDVVDVAGSKSVTLYFLAENGKNSYYVPVTRRVSSKGEDGLVTTVVDELIKGPNVKSNLLSEFHPDMKLLGDPKYENGEVTLNFNEAILTNLDGSAVSSQLVNSLVLSLTEQPGINSVAIKVDGKKKIFNDSGKEISAPVSRPEKVNTGSF